MEKYNYMETIENDILDYIENENVNVKNYNRDELEEKLYDNLWTVDSVTGNGSGSYTFNTYEAEENICHNMDLLGEALEEFGSEDVNIGNKGAEWCDVTIRCYLLGNALSNVLDKLYDE